MGSETLVLSGAGTLADKNVATNKTIGVGTLSLADGGGGGLAANYTLSSGTHLLTINKKPVSITGTRTYDATTATLPTDLSIGGLVGGESLSLTGQGTIADQNVGAGKTITLNTLTLNDGANPTHLASNYTFTGGTHTFDVTQAPLSTSGSRQYDGTVNFDNSIITVSGLQGGETLTVDDDINTNNVNVGTYNTGSSNLLVSDVNNSHVTYKKIADHGGNGTKVNWPGTSNHELTPDSGESTEDFTQRALELMNTSGSGIAYFVMIYSDNTKTTATSAKAKASASVVGSGISGKDLFTVAANQSDIETATSKTTSDYGAGFRLLDGTGLASNYTITSNSFAITQRVLSSSGSRLYDATTTNASSSDLTLSNLIGSETLTLSGSGTLSDANVANNKTVTLGTLALADGTNGGLAANYTLSGGTHQLTVNQRPLNATLSRQYDGTTASAGSTLSSFDALQGGETLTLSGSGTSASANVANGIAMSSNGNLALVDGTGLASNYSLNSTVINITQRILNSSGSKTYDANTNALAGAITLSNLVSGEALNHSGTATTSSANAGSYTITNLAGITIADGSGGAASNYTLTGGTHNFTVNPKVVSIQGNKTYDGNTTISSGDITSVTDTVGTQTLVISGGSGTVSSANAATYASVGINEGTLTLGNGTNGGLASNYTLTGHAASSFQVTQRVLSSSGSRIYDGSTTASSSDLTLSNLVGSETLTLSGNGTLANANVGTNKSVTLNTLSIADGTNGGLAANYNLTGGTHQLTVTQRVVNATGTRLYDATSNANSSDLSLGNLVGSETLVLSGAGTLADKNVASNKIVGVGTLSLADGSNNGLAANYTLSSGTHLLTINQKPVNITGTRAYDATAITLPTDLSIGGLVGGESISLTGQGSIANKNVGNGKTITLNTLTLNNGANPTHLASNYTFTGGTHTFDVTKRTLTFSGTKVYDGNMRVVSSSELTTITNLNGGETLTFSGSGSVASANVQSGQSIANGTLSINDGTGLASNYNLTTGTFDITQRWVTLTGARNYNGRPPRIALI